MPVGPGPDWQEGRFGNADAARVNLDDFIPISGVLPDPHLNAEAMEDRIIVGRKGAGKTLYLRKLGEEARKRSLLTLDEEDGLETDLVRYMLMRLREYVQSVDRTGDLDSFVDRRKAVISIWRTVWEKAILVSTLSLYISHKRRNNDLKITASDYRHRFQTIDDLETYFVNTYSDLFPLPLAPTTPQASIRLFANNFDSPRQIQKFMNDPKWVELHSIIQAVATEIPAIAIYIDAIDLEFEDAPEAFLMCQLGLYRAVAQSGFSSSSFAGRIHAVAALRDIVFSAVLRSEHAGRYYQNRHVKLLEWTPATIRRFMAEKLRQVLVRRSAPSRPPEPFIREWLGFTEFTNGRGQSETVVDYLLRHGRMLPRDIIMFLNAIDAELKRRTSENKVFSEKSLRKAVAEVANVIGNEMLSICMNEMLSSSDLFGDFISGVKGREMYGSDFHKFIADKVRVFFSLAKEETLTVEQLQHALIASELADQSHFEAGAHTYYRFDNLLWRHGLLAFRDVSGSASKWRFNWKGAIATDVIPVKAVVFGFHSSLIDVHGIRASPDGPVY